MSGISHLKRLYGTCDAEFQAHAFQIWVMGAKITKVVISSNTPVWAIGVTWKA